MPKVTIFKDGTFLTGIEYDNESVEKVIEVTQSDHDLLITGNYGFDENDNILDIRTAEQKTEQRTNKANDIFEKNMNSFLKGYSSSEISTFTRQVEQSRYILDNEEHDDKYCGFIKKIANKRGINYITLAEIVLGKAEIYEDFISDELAKKKKYIQG